MEHDAAAIILVHNQPSGDPAPSEQDVVTTRQLSGLARALDIKLIEHIIVAGSDYALIGKRACDEAVGRTTTGHILRDTGLKAASDQDRKRVVQGKRVSVRVGLGGRGIINKQQIKILG